MPPAPNPPTRQKYRDASGSRPDHGPQALSFRGVSGTREALRGQAPNDLPEHAGRRHLLRAVIPHLEQSEWFPYCGVYSTVHSTVQGKTVPVEGTVHCRAEDDFDELRVGLTMGAREYVQHFQPQAVGEPPTAAAHASGVTHPGAIRLQRLHVIANGFDGGGDGHGEDEAKSSPQP